MIGTLKIEDTTTFMYIKNKVKAGLFLVSVNPKTRMWPLKSTKVQQKSPRSLNRIE